jgi:hypothetical protein
MNPSCPEPRNFLPSSWPQRARALARLGVSTVLTTALATALLAGCGGGGGGDGQDAGPPPPPPPPTNREPVAAFSAAASVVAGQPLVLDASASSDADGDPLSHSWDFGEGRRGGGARIARIFDTPGTVAVTLTVTDGRGGSSRLTRNVSVTAAPAAVGQVDTLVVVRDVDGALVPGVAVSVVQGGNAPVLTDGSGRATVSTPRGVPLVLRLAKDGFADQIRSLDLPPVAESGYLEATLLAREPALTLASAAAGGTLTGKHGARVVFPPGAIVDAAGNPVSGAVQVAITPVDVVNRPFTFPGRFAGLRPDGQQGLLLSHGTMEVSLSAGGARAQLAPGRTATIDIPIYATLSKAGTPLAVGDRSPVWSLDERTGGWIEEASGTVVAAATPTGLALRAEVSHFSWWNHDAFDTGGDVEPRCKVDTNLDGIAEDITESGYCAMLGSPPGPGGGFSTFGAGDDRARALAAGGPGERAADGPRALTTETPTVRLPTFVAQDTVPVNGGKRLGMPANVDILLRGYARNGSLTGSRVVRVGPGGLQQVDLILYPIDRIEDSRTVTLPFDGSFGQQAPGEIDRISFAATAGAAYEIVVQRAPGSLFDAGVVVSRDGTELASGSVSSSGFTGTVAAGSGGTVTVAVTAGANAPGSYRITVRSVAGCGSPEPLALPSNAPTVTLPAGGERCFSVALAADEVLEVSTTGQVSARGTARLLAPGGAEIDADTYGSTGTDRVLLRAAVAMAGTYQLLISNTATTAGGGLQNLRLSRITPTAVLNPGESTVFDVPEGSRPDAFFVLKAPAGSPMALLVEAGVSDQQMQFWPGGAALQDARDRVLVRVRSAPSASHTLLRVTKFASASPAHRYTVFNRVPDVLTLDSDFTAALETDRRAVRVFAIDSSLAERLSVLALVTSFSALDPLGTWLFDPAGNVVPTTTGLRRLQAAGLHTLLITNNTGRSGTATGRVNRVVPIEVDLASPFVRNAPLALGEVLMLRTPVTQGQLVALALSSSAPLPLIARAPTSGAGSSLPLVLTVDSAGTGPVSGIGGPVYASSTGTADLFVQATGSTLATAQGPLSLTLSSPAAVPTAVGAAFTASVPPTSFAARGYSFPAPVRTLVCMTHTPAPIGTTQVRLFGNGAPPAFYGGDMVFNLPSGEPRLEQLGRTRVAGAHTLTIANVRGADVAGRLLVMEPPGAVAPGTAVPAQTLATPCDRRFFSFAATAGQSFTVRVTAGFAGTLYVRKQEAGGDWTARTGGTFVGSIDVPGSPASLSANTERVLSFTIPSTSALGTGTYIIEVDASDDATGGFSLSLSSP